MHLSKSFSCKALVAIAVLSAALPALAQKRRAVAHPGQSGPPLQVVVTGTVVDAVTGQPVVFADVRLGNRVDRADRQGKFRISTTIRGTQNITASRSGYVSGSLPVSTAGTHDLTIRLASTPTVTLRTTAGQTMQIDYESVEFGYVPPFGSYIKATHDDFCRADGTQVTLDRAQFTRFIGPATLESQSACCGSGPLLRVNAQLKTGETLPLYFLDSCNQQYSIDFIGRNHVTGDFEFTKFTDVAEIIFP